MKTKTFAKLNDDNIVVNITSYYHVDDDWVLPEGIDVTDIAPTPDLYWTYDSSTKVFTPPPAE